MFEFIFIKLPIIIISWIKVIFSSFINFIKLIICKLIFINHRYKIIEYSEPFYNWEMTGSGQGQYICNGYNIIVTKKCIICGKIIETFIYDYMGNIYKTLEEIPSISLPKETIPNDIETKIKFMLLENETGIYNLNLQYIKNEISLEKLEKILKKYNTICTFNTLNDRNLLIYIFEKAIGE